MPDVTIVNPVTLFKNSKFRADGLYVSYQPIGLTTPANVLSGRKITNINRGEMTWEQTAVNHMLSSADFEEYVSGRGKPGELTVTYDYDPQDELVKPDTDRSSYAQAGQGWLFLARVEFAADQSVSKVVVFFQQLANIASTGGWSGDTGAFPTTSTKFQLVGSPVVAFEPEDSSSGSSS